MSRFATFWTNLWAHLPALGGFADAPPRDYPFVASDVAQLHRVRAAAGAYAVDAQTWRDLLLDDYLARLSSAVSIFGRQVLYRRLREGQAPDARAALSARLQALQAAPEQVEAARQACLSLRQVDTEVATLLFEETLPRAPWWVGHTWPLPLLLAGFSALAILWSPLAWCAVGGLLYLLLSTQLRHAGAAEAWQRKSDALQMLLRASSLLGARKDILLAAFAPHAAAAGALNRALSRPPASAVVPGLRTYLDWFMLDNVNHYFRSMALVTKHRDFLGDCFERCATLEADLTLARHLSQAPLHCTPTFGRERELLLDGAVHPLLPHAQPLSLDLQDKGVFISGQNGVGKSTLLRTVGLNLVAARAFGFCYAASARLPDLPVYASMQTEDALLGGESLYMAELRCARELLASSAGPHPGVIIVDEIFRGTNHMESVSAASAVVDALAARVLVLVSSHNLVLAPLLAHRLDPVCVSADAEGVLTVAPGVLAHTNGIALLTKGGFGSQVERNAGRVFDWLTSYLAHPVEGAQLLAVSDLPPQSGGESVCSRAATA